MKILLSFLFLFLSFASFSQADTSDRDLQYQTEYIFELLKNSSIAILKYDSPTIKETSLVLSTEVEKCANFEGLTLELASGATLSFKNSSINCENLTSGKNKLTSILALTPELYQQLKQTEITAFYIGTVKTMVHFKEKGENYKEFFKFAEGYYDKN